MGDISRRSFIGGLSALATASALGLAGCSGSSSATQDTESAEIPDHVDETRAYDIVVVGAGCSGLSAALEAAEQGASVICVETFNVVGGSASGIEGMFGVNSQMQKDAGIDVNLGALVRNELTQSQYRNSSLVLRDLAKNSGENIDWLADHGVEFDHVDEYAGTEKLFHWFNGGTGAVGFVPQMQAAAEAAGVEFLLNTQVNSLIQSSDGKVTGVYATNNDDGTVLEIDAKAVLLATGGVIERTDLLEKMGYTEDRVINAGICGNGTGYDMATAVGGASNVENAGILGCIEIPGLPSFVEGGYFCSVLNPVSTIPTNVWVNGNGERVANEDMAQANFMLSANLARVVDSMFILIDDETMQTYVNGDPQGKQELADALEQGIFFKADNWDDIAAASGMDPDTLNETVESYNACCADSDDSDFGKDAAYLKALPTSGTVYAMKAKAWVSKAVGSLRTDRDFRVLTDSDEAIEGLYAVGVEGAMIWSGVYTVNISGSCSAHAVYSGRTAVRHALNNLL